VVWVGAKGFSGPVFPGIVVGIRIWQATSLTLLSQQRALQTLTLPPPFPFSRSERRSIFSSSIVTKKAHPPGHCKPPNMRVAVFPPPSTLLRRNTSLLFLLFADGSPAPWFVFSVRNPATFVESKWAVSCTHGYGKPSLFFLRSAENDYLYHFALFLHMIAAPACPASVINGLTRPGETSLPIISFKPPRSRASTRRRPPNLP